MIKIKFIKNISSILIITLLMAELIIHNAVNWLPEDMIMYLSPSAAEEIYKKRGQIQDEELLTFHYQPFQKMNLYPHIKIDENGYRNSINRQTKVDTVLLGDSIIFSKNSKVDLGDLFRKNGRSALNLAIAGYAPQHYRDAYQKYVIEKNIQHNNVVVNIFVGNDFNDSDRYPWKLSTPLGMGKEYYPWIFNAIIGSIKIHGRTKIKNIELKESVHRITLPYKEIGIRYLWWTPEPTKKQYDEVDKALRDILSMADSVNAKVSLVIFPSPASVYGVKLYPDFSNYVERHNNIVNEFRKRFKGVNLIDPNKEIAKEIEKQFLYIDESDSHFNTSGIKFFFDIILDQ